jgi:hypothetical protein
VLLGSEISIGSALIYVASQERKPKRHGNDNSRDGAKTAHARRLQSDNSAALLSLHAWKIDKAIPMAGRSIFFIPLRLRHIIARVTENPDVL